MQAVKPIEQNLNKRYFGKEIDQVEVMLEMLIQNGRAGIDKNGFALCHDDVLIALELIRGRVVAIAESISS